MTAPYLPVPLQPQFPVRHVNVLISRLAQSWGGLWTVHGAIARFSVLGVTLEQSDRSAARFADARAARRVARGLS